MSVFGAYSSYYNLLYKDKDYDGEATYIDHLIGKHSPGAKSVLDLGCGTGRHDLLLARMGYEVTGIDLSNEMILVANNQLSSVNGVMLSLNFQNGDMRTIRLEKSFDVVISLFHVVSYLISDEELSAAFATASAHLKAGGIFIFDCWYGPAVLTDRPCTRIKRLEDEEISVTRIAEPVLYPNDNVVDVNYHVIIGDKKSGEMEELRETHRMRYLFRPEIELCLRRAGMNIIEVTEWLTGREPGFDTWGICFVVRG